MADQAQLLRWYDSFTGRPPVYLVHGEIPAAEALAMKLRERGANATVTRPGLQIDLAAVNALAGDRPDSCPRIDADEYTAGRRGATR